MNVREKLVELLSEKCMETCKQRKGYVCSVEECKRSKEKCCGFYADHLIANGVTVQEWISVNDRLPEVRVPVLTYGIKGAVGIGFTQPTSVTADGKVYFYARYGDSLPTHWMPIPQPPKGE